MNLINRKHSLVFEPLNKNHDRFLFDCGNDILNRFIKQLASQIIKRQEAVIYVSHENGRVIGFYTLSADKIQKSDSPDELKNQSPHTAIPCILIGRLAVDKNYQGMGIGIDLLAHALRRAKRTAELIGVAFVIVDAKDEQAKSFYQSYGFFELQNTPLRMAFPVSKIEREE